MLLANLFDPTKNILQPLQVIKKLTDNRDVLIEFIISISKCIYDGTTILSKEAFKFLLERLDSNKISTLAIDIATKAPKEFILFKWKEIGYQI